MTVIFEDSFESGGLTNWSASNSPTNTAINTTRAWVRQGRYSCRFTSASSSSVAIYLQKNIPDADEVYLRFYTKITAPSAPSIVTAIYLAQLRSASGSCAQLSLINQSGNAHLQLHYYSGQNLYKTSTAPLLFDTVYCVELHFKRGSNSAVINVYLNGGELQEMAVTGANITAQCSSVLLGSMYNSQVTGGFSTFYDDVMVSDSYIGTTGIMLLASEHTPLVKQEIVDYIWGFENGAWLPSKKTIPTGNNLLRLFDTEQKLEADLFEIIIDEELAPPNKYSRIIGISTGLTVKKDIAAGGYVSANQGLIGLGSGVQNSFDPPGAWMMHGNNKKINFKGTSDPPNPRVGWRVIRTDLSIPSGNMTYYRMREYQETTPGNYGWVNMINPDYPAIPYVATTDNGYSFGSTRPSWGAGQANQWFITVGGNQYPHGHIHFFDGSNWTDMGDIDDSPYNGFFDTFEIRKIGYKIPIRTEDYGHLRCANITAHNTNPAADATYGLGSPEKRWKGICAQTIYVDAIKDMAGNDWSFDLHGGTVNENITIQRADPQLVLNATLGNPALKYSKNSEERMGLIYHSEESYLYLWDYLENKILASLDHGGNLGLRGGIAMNGSISLNGSGNMVNVGNNAVIHSDGHFYFAGEGTIQQYLTIHGGLTLDGQLELPSLNAGIELGHPTNGGTPYIDFHFGKGVSQDFNVRLINDADGWLHLDGHFKIGGDLDIRHSGEVFLNIDSTNSNLAAINIARGGNSQAMFGVGTNNRAYINTANDIPLDLRSGSGGIWAQNDFIFQGAVYLRNTYPAINWFSADAATHYATMGYGSFRAGNPNVFYLYSRLDSDFVIVSRAGRNIVLAPSTEPSDSSGGQVVVAGGHSINPQGSNGSGTLGNATYYWKDVYADKYRGKSTTIGLFDMVDDLQIVAEFESETIIEKCPKTGQDVERLVISKESLKKVPGLLDEDDFYDNGNAIGFTFSCLNRIVKRVQSVETEAKRIESLEAKLKHMESLETEVRELKALLSAQEERAKKSGGVA